MQIKGGGRSSSQAVKSGLGVDLVNTVFESLPLGGHFTHSSSREGVGGGDGGGGGEERSNDRHGWRRRGMKHVWGVSESPVPCHHLDAICG